MPGNVNELVRMMQKDRVAGDYDQSLGAAIRNLGTVLAAIQRRTTMTRNELMAYGMTAVLGGAIAGYIGGLIGVLGVFGGLGIVGYADLVVHLRQTY